MFNTFSRRDISLNSGPHDSSAALERLCEGFLSLRDRVRSSSPVPKHVRDAVRGLLANDRLLPRRGEQPTCLDHLIQTLFCVRNPFVDIELHCTQCHHTWPTPYLANDYVLCASSNEFTRENHSSVSTAFIMHTLLTQSRAVFCPVCRCLGADRRTTFRTYPAFILVIEAPAFDDRFPSLIVDLTVDLRPSALGWGHCRVSYILVTAILQVVTLTPMVVYGRMTVCRNRTLLYWNGAILWNLSICRHMEHGRHATCFISPQIHLQPNVINYDQRQISLFSLSQSLIYSTLAISLSRLSDWSSMFVTPTVVLPSTLSVGVIRSASNSTAAIRARFRAVEVYGLYRLASLTGAFTTPICFNIMSVASLITCFG
jgi:hypothetical protein